VKLDSFKPTIGQSDPNVPRVGRAQLQMVVPISATALDLAQYLSDDELLSEAYQAGSRWDDWLARYRNTRDTGLCEAFCEYDTGHDGSTRTASIPNACCRRCLDSLRIYQPVCMEVE